MKSIYSDRLNAPKYSYFPPKMSKNAINLFQMSPQTAPFRAVSEPAHEQALWRQEHRQANTSSSDVCFPLIILPNPDINLFSTACDDTGHAGPTLVNTFHFQRQKARLLVGNTCRLKRRFQAGWYYISVLVSTNFTE